MSHVVNLDKHYRLTIPIKIIRTINLKPADYLKIILRKNNYVDYFYLRMPNKQPSRKEVQVRRKLSNRIIENLRLLPNDTLLIESINKLVTMKSDKPFVDGKFDLLFLANNGLMVDTFFKNGEEWCRFWSSSKFGGIAKEVELKRFIPINRETGEFFGLMQAESRKYGEKFDFTNIFVSQHKKFIDVAEILGISRKLWRFGLINNPHLKIKQVEEYKNKFAKEVGISVSKGYETISNTVTDVAYSIYISSTILNRVMNQILEILRKPVILELKKEITETIEDFCKGFIIKDLLGDGTVINLQDNSIDIFISEQNKVVQQDIVEMLKIFGINVSVDKNHINISGNLATCLWLIENDTFIEHKENRRKLIEHVLNQETIKTIFDRFSDLDVTSIKKFAKMHDLSYSTALMFLFRYVHKNVLKTAKSKDRRKTLYLLNDEGKRMISLIEKAKAEIF